MISNPKKFAFINLRSYDLSLEIYDMLKLDFKDSGEYKTYAIGGMIFYKHNIEDCYKKKEAIVEEISQMFKKARKDDSGTIKHYVDKSGESTTTDFVFWFKSKRFSC